ncbi:hypothetical protein [Falsiroseomonas oryzae]|uniref:hypothetical protein n=1 Tax=Falsiroseomonas oryzae TaxID=2766473 RepID=UPI0022EAB238|nr:hypothetical protein [Roseomonas sp. MO-31]
MRAVKRGLTAILVALASCATAQAQTYEIGRFGLWRAYEGRSNNGTPVCGISSEGRERSLHIKYFEGAAGFDVHVFDEGWNIPEEVPVRVAFEFGGTYRSAPLNARGYPRRGNLPANVQIAFSARGSENFWSAFRLASEGRLVFHTGNEGSWRINLTGSNAATSAMLACINRMAGGRRPFDGAAVRTPFDTNAVAPPRPLQGQPK